MFSPFTPIDFVSDLTRNVILTYRERIGKTVERRENFSVNALTTNTASGTALEKLTCRNAPKYARRLKSALKKVLKRMKRFLMIFCLLLAVGEPGIRGSATFGQVPVNPPRRQVAFLTFRANLYFGDQDEEIVPIEADFYLLDQSLVQILKAAKFEPVDSDDAPMRPTDEDYLEAAARALTSENDEEAEVIVFLIKEAITRHQLSVARTGDFGRGKFRGIKEGKYYLFGVAKTESEVAVWNLPIQVEPGINSLGIDQNNAAVIFSVNQ